MNLSHRATRSHPLMVPPRWHSWPFPTYRTLWILTFGVFAFLPALNDPRWLTYLFVGFLLLFILAFVDYGLTLGTMPLKVRRIIPNTGTVERPHEVRLVLQNLRAYPFHIRLYDDIPSYASSDLPLEAYVPAKSRVQIRYVMVPRRRGRFQIDRVFITLSGPLRLACRPWTCPLESPLEIMPDFREAVRFSLQWKKNPFPEGPRQHPQTGAGTEFTVLRPYVVGDDWRHIDWLATARHRSPFVKVYHRDVHSTLVLVMDISRAMSARWEGKTRLDYAVAAAVNVAYLALTLGDTVRWFVYDNKISTYSPWLRGIRRAHDWLKRIGDLEPSPLEPNYNTIGSFILAKVDRPSIVVWFSSISDLRMTIGFQKILHALSRRHAPLFVNLQDPSIGNILYNDPRNKINAFSVTLASRIMMAQRLLERELTRSGIRCLRPDDANVVRELMRSYIEIRQRTA